MEEENKLTSQSYWESYYKRNHVSKENIVNVCSYYDEFWDHLISENPDGKSIIEIGGFPGRYLAYLASKYTLEPTCLDYNSDILQIEATFKVMNVETYHILQEDFTKFKPINQYDYVISNGFIEHFENFDEILDLHLQYLKPNGKLLIMIPNMRGYIHFYKYLVDYRNLKIHNLKSMNLKVFKAFAKRNSLEVEKLTYFGDFPHTVHQKQNPIQNIISKSHRLLFKKGINQFVNRYPSANFSSSIISIFQKK